MQDTFNLPLSPSGIKIFTTSTGVNGQGYEVFQKPKNANFINFFVVAGGGGGGGGFSRTAGSAGGGGGGGACSGITRFYCPAILLPDTMYIQVGHGGTGGAASGAGNAGINSYVTSYPITGTPILPNIIAYSGVNAPGGGGAGTGAAVGSAGTVPTIAVTQPFNTLGEWFTIVGLVGVAGGAVTGAVGTSVTAWGALPLTPGAGGAGCTTTDFGGGNVTSTALFDISNLGHYTTTAGSVALGGTGITTAINGGGGVKRITPFFNSGGAGGGSNNSGQAGHGGSGGYGCGGGGGGAGTTGGKGGDGGSGIVIITYY